MTAIKIRYIPLDEVAKWPRNPKTHDYEGIKKSIRRFGFVQPVVVDEGTKKLVAGHGRQESLSQMKADGEEPPDRIKVDTKGRWLIPVVAGINFANEKEAAAFLVADNRMTEVGGWDYSDLLDMVRGLDDDELADLTGFDSGDLTAMEVEILADNTDAYAQPPEPAAKPGPPAVKGNIRRLMFYMSQDDYKRTIDLLGKAMEDLGTKDHSATIVKMLEVRYGSSADTG